MIWEHEIREYISREEVHIHQIREVLFKGASPRQNVQVVQTALGRAMLLDGRLQSVEADEWIYHEALVHPALVLADKPERALIIGGGTGGALREVLRHPTVKSATLVDIDPVVVKLAREYLPYMHAGALEDPRATLVIGEGRTFLETSEQQWDTIILDPSEPLEGQSPSVYLFTREFYEIVHRRLAPGGTLALWAGAAHPPTLWLFPAVVSTLRCAFRHVVPYTMEVPSFGTPWGFALASATEGPLGLTARDVDAVLTARGIASQLRAYDGLTHQRMFILPRHLREALARAEVVLTDATTRYTFPD
jgi:spermidine synthase